MSQINEHKFIPTAETLIKAGLSAIPVGRGKQAWCKWSGFEDRAMTTDEVHQYFAYDAVKGIAIICGAVSGNLEVMDVENAETAEEYLSLLRDRIPKCLASLPMIKTPRGGIHLYYRHRMEPRPGKRLACREVNGAPELLAETRGQGHYVVSCFAEPEVHPLNRPWTLVQGDIFNIPTLEDHERECLWRCARSLDQMPKDVVKPPATTITNGSTHLARPGDDFNARAGWASILEPLGWSVYRQVGGKTEWTRPGSKLVLRTIEGYIFS